MTGKELVKEISVRSGMNFRVTELFMKTYIDILLDKLNEGEDVSISGFGRFHVVERHERKIVHPKTGKCITVKRRKSLIFRPSGITVRKLHSYEKEE